VGNAERGTGPRSALQNKNQTMNRYFAIYHGLHDHARWGVAMERKLGGPRAELLMLCRTEAEAEHYSALMNEQFESKAKSAAQVAPVAVASAEGN